jgi:uncharacterized repeat protein (TIGR04052 family)
MNKTTLTLGALSACALAVLTACGGSGSSDNATSFSGTAAVGAAITGATVSAKCVSGTPESAVTTGSDGGYSLKVTDATLPCIIKISGGKVGAVDNMQALHTLATAAGTAHITPFTEMVVARAFGTDANTAFAGLTSTTASSAKAALGDAQNYVKTVLADAGVTAPTVDLVTGTLKVGDTNYDAALETLKTKLTASGTTVAELAKAAANQGANPTNNGKQTVSLQFAMVAGNTPIGCNQAIEGLGTANTTAQLKDARFYISQVNLVRLDGSAVPLTLGANDDWNHTAGDDRVSLIDLENATGSCPTTTGTVATNDTITGTAPAGLYTGVQFVMGVPFALNHTSTTASTTPVMLQNASLAWSWQSGRKFAKVEVTDPGTSTAWPTNTFNFHLGSTACTGNPANGETTTCANPNRMTVPLSGFDYKTQKIAFDVKALLAGEDVTKNDGGTANLAGTAWTNSSTGCMSGSTDGDCITVFDALQLNLAAGSGGTSIDGGKKQRVFKAIAK